MEVILNDLPYEHLLRNIPLAGMYYRRPDAKILQQISSAYGIAKKTYNQLGGPWLTDIFIFIDNRD